MSSIEVQVSSVNVESKRRGRPRREGAVVCSGDELVERLACVSVDVGGDGVRESVECGLMGNEEVCGVVLREEKEKEEVKKEKALAREERLKEKEHKKEEVKKEKALAREELKKEKAAMKEEAKAAAKAARELAKKEEKEVKEQMKEEVKKEKEEAKAAAKLAKEEAKAAAKAAKAEERAASKAAAKAEKAAQKSATKKTKNTKNTKKTLTPTSRDTAKVEDTEAELEPEMSVEVRMFEHEGTPYLKDDAGALYSADTHEELGMWDATTQKIELRKQPSTGYVREGDELCDP
mgnify:CR=1 FL=1